MLGPDRILALDIGAATIKLAEFQSSKTHGLRLTNFNYADLGLDPEQEAKRREQIVSSIRNAMRERGIRTRRVIFSVSGQSVFTRFVKLPPVDESKVVQIIQYEAQQNVPFPIDEVIWDYQLLGSTPQGELEVVLLAIKSDIIDDLNDAVEEAGLRTDLVDVAPMALYNAVRYNYGELSGCTVVVDIGARTTNLLFIEQNRIFSRAIPIAGNAITQSIASEFNLPFADAERLKISKGFVALGGAYEEPADAQQSQITKIVRNVMTRLHAEVARSINFYRSQQGGGPPARLLLSGGSSVLPYTDRFFQEKIQVPVEYFNPFRNVVIDPAVPREELARCAHFLGEVVGLGLRRVTECPVEVSLLPHSVRRHQQVQAKRPYLVGAAICLLLVPICWLAYTQRVTGLKQKELQQVKDRADALQRLSDSLNREKQQFEQVRARADSLARLVEQRSYWPALLQDLNTRVTPGLWLIKLQPQTGESGTTETAATLVVNRPGGRIRGGAPVEQPAAAPPSSGESQRVNELWIEGGGPHSADHPEQDLELVGEFVANLRKSPWFDPQGVEIVVPPNPMTKEPTFAFTVRARLAKPFNY